MQSGEISDGQIMSPFADTTQFLNPWAGRLNSGAEGWYPHNGVYRIHFKTVYLIAYMEHQAMPRSDVAMSGGPYTSFSLKYAMEQNVFRTVMEKVEGVEVVSRNYFLDQFYFLYYSYLLFKMNSSLTQRAV